MAHFVLVPGLWLQGSSWEAVSRSLQAHGHTSTAVSLPATAGTSLQEWLDTVVRALDAQHGNAVLVGHSAGCGLAYAAADARPEKVTDLVLIGGFPTPPGQRLLEDSFPVTEGLIPLPDFSNFEMEDLADLDEEALALFETESQPVPASVFDTPITLQNPKRHRIPATAICTEYSSADLQRWTEVGFSPTTELPLFEQLGYVDLPTGHWPQFSRPEDLAEVLRGITTV